MRTYLAKLEKNQQIKRVNRRISKDYQIAGGRKQLEPQAVWFANPEESGFPVAGNLFTSKQALARYFNLAPEALTPHLVNAIEHPTIPPKSRDAPCQQVVTHDIDLDELPILKHSERDGGRYISSGVVFAAHPAYGQNIDFHRCMQISKNELAVRVVRNRHFDLFLKGQKQMDIAICIGVSPAVLLAAATSVELGQDELEIAHTLEPMEIVKAHSVDLWIPADCEFVLEGTIRLEKTHPEGPFIDLTGTYDIIRDQPVVEIKTITHRKDAFWHALLPGGLEHKMLMGLPREPTIFQKVNQVVKCLDVNITPGGASWLHAVIQIDKEHELDGKAAIEAAFAGHRSCKHVFVVDRDIDIYDPSQVEWAMATRFQGNRDILILPREQGSSLDPSADPNTHFTSKIGFDLTKPVKGGDDAFIQAKFPEVKIDDWLSG